MNDFGCRHSDKLQEFFDIENRGIDYINDFGIKFEFKESWMKDIKQMFFKVPMRQLINSDFIVFCAYDRIFMVHGSKYLLGKYDFDNNGNHCCLRLGTVRRNYVKKFYNYVELKEYINSVGGF